MCVTTGDDAEGADSMLDAGGETDRTMADEWLVVSRPRLSSSEPDDSQLRLSSSDSDESYILSVPTYELFYFSKAL
jgi:hypothetical protein